MYHHVKIKNAAIFFYVKCLKNVKDKVGMYMTIDRGNAVVLLLRSRSALLTLVALVYMPSSEMSLASPKSPTFATLLSSIKTFLAARSR